MEMSRDSHNCIALILGFSDLPRAFLAFQHL
jgi:hypothetical protein